LEDELVSPAMTVLSNVLDHSLRMLMTGVTQVECRLWTIRMWWLEWRWIRSHLAQGGSFDVTQDSV